MGADLHESRRERSEERHWGGSPARDIAEGVLDDSEENDKERSRDRHKHRSKDKKKSRSDVKDHRAKDKDRSKTSDGIKEREKEVKDSDKERISSKDKKKDEKEDHDKDRTKDKGKEKDHDRDKQRAKDHDRNKDEKDRGRKRDRERERDNEPGSDRVRDKEKAKEKSKDKEREKEKGKDRDRGKDREKEKEKERTRDRGKEREQEKNRDIDMLEREQERDNNRERDKGVDNDKERSKDKDKTSRRSREDYDYRKDGGKDVNVRGDVDFNRNRDISKSGKTSSPDVDDTTLIKQGDYAVDSSVALGQSQRDLEERILKMKEERLKKRSEGASEILSWVNNSRKLEEKRISEKEKALRRSKLFEEQDNIDEYEDDDGIATKEAIDALAGVKVLHGIDKVLEGGSVVLTLKDQEILADGDVNEDVDMLENVEIGEQKRRQEAYRAAKNNAAVYDDKFNDQPGDEKKMLPQYDDPAEEEGVTLDIAGRFSNESQKKLEELRRRLEGPSLKNQVEDLNSSVKTSSDYYTAEEMLKFKKPKKKKSLRKKEKLDLDALEAEARAEGLGASDHGSRRDSRRQAAKEEEERAEADRRSSAYLAAFAKADEASRALRMDQTLPLAKEEDDTEVFADDAEDLHKSLERARKLALKKQTNEAPAGPEAVARLASSAISSQTVDAENSTSGDALDNKVVFTEMEEFVWGLQLDEESQKPTNDDVFMEEDEAPEAAEDQKDETSGWTEVVESGNDDQPKPEDKEEIVPDDTIHEAPLGKGLSATLQFLKERGTLKETVEWGGRNMDKKKSKLVGIYDEEGPKEREIHLERTDEYGRVLTPKESFRLLSHRFHGKGPGKMKQEKRMKQYYDELKQKQLTSSDTLPQSVERMREAQSQLKTPYLVLSGQVKTGQTSDPRSGFGAVEKEGPGSLTPMLGDEKVEHFLGIKRKGGPGSSSNTPKKPKP